MQGRSAEACSRPHRESSAAHGGIPWHLPEDLARFKNLTWAHRGDGPAHLGVVAGRVRPLPAATSSSDARARDFRADGATVVAPGAGAAGGRLGDRRAQIYALALPLATRCEVTEVDIDLRREDDDALCPQLDETWVGTAGTG